MTRSWHLDGSCAFEFRLHLSNYFVHTIIIYSIIFFQEQTKYCLSNCHGRKGLEMEILIIPNFHVLLCLIEQSDQKILPLSGPLLPPYYFDGWFPNFFTFKKHFTFHSIFHSWYLNDVRRTWYVCVTGCHCILLSIPHPSQHIISLLDKFPYGFT